MSDLRERVARAMSRGAQNLCAPDDLRASEPWQAHREATVDREWHHYADFADFAIAEMTLAQVEGHDAAIAAGVGADTKLRRAATDALAAYDAIGMGPRGWSVRDREAFAVLRSVLAPTPPAPPETGEAET